MAAVELTVVLLVAVAAYLAYRRMQLTSCPAKVIESFLERASRGPIAHRASQPENTLAGIRRSKQLGASGVEVDVYFTKDGHPVLIHDATVDRTSDGRGKVCEMTLREVKELDVGSKFGSEFAGERIPTVQEAVSLCRELDLQIYLEFKGTTQLAAEQAASAVRKLFAEMDQIYTTVAVMSFWPNVVYMVRKANPNVVCGLLLEHGLLVDYPNVTEWWKHFFFHRPFDLLFWSADKWLWRILRPSLISIDKRDVISGRYDIRKWKIRGIPTIAWTVNSEEEQQFFKDVLQIPYITDIIRV